MSLCPRTAEQEVPVSIVVLTHNRRVVLSALLDQLLQLRYSPLELIVVDNHSTDGTSEMLKEGYSGITHIRTERNLGACGRSRGMAACSGEVVITLDDDLLGFTDEHILHLVAVFGEKRQVGAVNFRVVEEETGRVCNWVHHRVEEEWRDIEFETYEITEGAVGFRRSALVTVGLYPEEFFISHEGIDLALRMIDAGYEVIYFPDIVIRHKRSKLGRTSWLNYYYDTRNLFWVAARNLPVGYGILYVARGVLAMAAYAVKNGFFVYWIRGVKDGVMGIRAARSSRKKVNAATMRKLRQLDQLRPPLWYIIRKRLFAQNGARI